MAGKDEIMGEVAQHTEEIHKLSSSRQKATPGDNSSLEEKFQRLTESYEKGIIEPPMAKIQRVPFSLRCRKHFEKYFEPRGVALGPIHHKKPGLELAEMYKQRLAEYFIRESGCDKFNTYNEIEKDVENLRACYDDEVTECYDDKELAWMFFVDGSSLLAFIACSVDERRNMMKHMKIKKDLAAFGLQDTFLLENQLPFRLLKLLIDQSTKDRERWINNIHDLVDGVGNHTINPNKSDRQNRSLKMKRTKSLRDDCPHLLHLLRERLVDQDSQNSNDSDDSTSSKTTRQQASSSSCNFGSKSNDDFLVNLPSDSIACNSLIGTSVVPFLFSKPAKSDDKLFTFRNITELKSAGIRVRPNQSSSSVKDIDFRKVNMMFPTLFLPPIVVDDWTAPKFLNLVAYEMCPDYFNNFGITSYLCFLDSLIDQPEDVKYLRDKEILHNVLGSDEEVATLFNEINTDLVEDDQAYLSVKQEIDKHYKKVWTKWVALGYHKYFSNPWTLFALVGALIGLALSFIQTRKAFEESCTKICRA